MDEITALFRRLDLAVARQAVAAVRGRVDDASHLARQLGIRESYARRILAVGRYFGRGTDRLAMGLSIDALYVVSSAAKKVRRDASMTPAEVRDRLLEIAHDVDCEELQRQANSLVEQANRGTDSPGHSRRFLNIGSIPDTDGLVSIIGRVSPLAAATLTSLLKPTAEHSDRRLTYGQRMADALESLSAESSRTAFQPMFILAAQDMRMHDEGLLDTTGRIWTLEEFAGAELADTGWAVVADRDGRLVGNVAMRHERFAPDLLRKALVGESVWCAHPGCERLADTCQFHHIEAHSRGGETTADNVIPACVVHNARNDDDPSKPKNGRLIRDPVSGRPGYQPPGGGEITFNEPPGVRLTGRGLLGRLLR